MPEDILYAVPWEELEKRRRVPAAVKSLCGKLNVPRERFWTAADGQFHVAQFA
ncbi:MAG TPA: hypothetical protein VKA46_39120 [Gemmataceae bacterium]|nr:hypothetical protein [Gemmataceae bacterium]